MDRFVQARTFQYNNKLLSANTVETVGYANAEIYDLGKASENLIADCVPMDYLDLLEVNQVEED